MHNLRRVMDRFPDWVKGQLPFVYTARGAVDVEILDLLMASVTNETAFSDFIARITEVTFKAFHRSMYIYYDMAADMKRQEGGHFVWLAAFACTIKGYLVLHWPTCKLNARGCACMHACDGQASRLRACVRACGRAAGQGAAM
jgi:hypothetical protein